MALGIVFSLLAAALLNGGNIVQKRAISDLDEVHGRHALQLVRTLASSRLWMTGFVLCIVGIGVQIMAFALAPIAVVQTIFNAGIVALIVVSRFRLGERLVRFEWIGLGIVIVSVVMMSLTLSSQSGSVGLGGSELDVLLAVIPTLLVTAALLGVFRRRGSAFLFGAVAGLLYGAAALGTKGSSTLVVKHGVIGAVPSILTSVYPYVFLIFSVLGMLIYQTGLQRYPISIMGAISDVICSTYVVIVGTIVFSEPLPKDPVTLWVRFAGFAGVLAGSMLVAFGGRRRDPFEGPFTESDLGVGPLLVGPSPSPVRSQPDDVEAEG